MKNTLLIVLCGIVMLGSGCSSLHKSTAANLQGTWNGREIGATPDTPRQMVISGNQLSYRGADTNDWGKGTFTLRNDTHPRQLLLTLNECGLTQYIGETSHVIYKIEDGTLTATGNEPGNPAAPTSFDAPGARQMVFTEE
jgi:uncharacterized protein (TIGR03067 family)